MGANRRHAADGAEDHDANGDWLEPSEGDIVTKNTLIGDIGEQLERVQPLVVHEMDSLTELAEKIIVERGARTLSVVDQEGRLVGIIPVSVLSDRIFFCVVPEEFIAEASNYEHLLQYASFSCGHRAKDVMHAPAWVKPGDRVRDAFVRMHEARVEGLPIVDDQMHVVGFVSIFELLSLWMKNREVG